MVAISSCQNHTTPITCKPHSKKYHKVILGFNISIFSSFIPSDMEGIFSPELVCILSVCLQGLSSENFNCLILLSFHPYLWRHLGACNWLNITPVAVTVLNTIHNTKIECTQNTIHYIAKQYIWHWHILFILKQVSKTPCRRWNSQNTKMKIYNTTRSERWKYTWPQQKDCTLVQWKKNVHCSWTWVTIW